MSAGQVARAQSEAEATEAALKAAAQAVGPSVVRIETSGGRESPGADGVRKGLGPTTGLVVGADGYVLTSTFNFADKPASVFVTVPGKPRQIAKQVATDKTRMLTLLKIEASGLPVPATHPLGEVRVGDWALALGRALGPDAAGPPSQSVGVVSALGRIYGKVIQCDAKVSPVNYGGPLVAIDGRVMGLLVPASPRGETEAAGVEWYDSGIGFAVPFADCLAATAKLKAGKDLERGTLGILMKDAKELYNAPVTVNTVMPDGSASRAGVKVGDTITKLDGKPVANASDLQHALGPKYAGDVVQLAVSRDGKEVDLGKVTLAAPSTAVTVAALGVAPLRDDPKPGVAVRGVFAGSAAAKAGLKPGDRVTKVGPEDEAEAPRGVPPLKDREQLATQLARLRPGAKVKLDVARAGGKTEALTVTLGERAAGVPAELPLTRVGRRGGETRGGQAGEGASAQVEPDARPRDVGLRPRELQARNLARRRRLAAPRRRGCEGRRRVGEGVQAVLRGPQRHSHRPAIEVQDRLGGERDRGSRPGSARRAARLHRSTATAWSRTAWATAGKWRSRSGSRPATCSPASPRWARASAARSRSRTRPSRWRSSSPGARTTRYSPTSRRRSRS